MSNAGRASTESSVAFVSNYLPRRCGIATFAHDLCNAVAGQAGESMDLFVVAMNDVPEGYTYPDRVRFEVRQNAPADYRLAADFLNISQVSAVCLQHEYGIFGGPAGSNILTMLRQLRRPLVTTLHTVLKDPDAQQQRVLAEIGRLSDRMVVLSETAVGILHDAYGVPTEKIAMIPHGIPDVPFVDPNFFKDKFGVEGRKVLLTFGLLGPGKGIEYAIDALPPIVARHPEVVYVVLGATHPHVKRDSGEEYRNNLIRRAHELGVADNVKFVNRFVVLDELCEFLGSADIYVTPYLSEVQIVSGTLAYALGAGKATISTPYWYAQEMLADGRGRLVPFRDGNAIAEQVIDLLDNETERHAVRKRAYNFTRKMIWSQVGDDYLAVFEDARENWVKRRLSTEAVGEVQRLSDAADELPEIDLRHLTTLTDDTGIIQHGIFATADRRYGYCTDDNARALIATAMVWDHERDETVLPLMQTYLSFLSHAMNEETGRFRNFMDYGRTWLDDAGSEDSHGRALWGLGVAVALSPSEPTVALATQLFIQGLPATEHFTSPRAWAFSIIGIHAYLRRFGGDSDARRHRLLLTERLADLFTNNMSDDWAWCENGLAYDNAKLPHALIMSGKWLNRGDWIDIGKHALQWLLDIQTNEDGAISIVGTDGWYTRGGDRARFDQQPVDVHALVDACVEAYHVTREEHWVDQARRVFNWFLGHNDLRTPVYDFTTGGCHDGLQPDRVNGNQGAESTLAWLMSLLLMHDLQMEQTLGTPAADEEMQDKPAETATKPQPAKTKPRQSQRATTTK
ncbi:MAG: glycosyltransferase family 4 protein [Planctomycetota bacterium]|jgi:glycosyltransferase involved in cell wall biosynthesis